jgi:glucosamine-6-phosphate deaminase
MQVILQPDTARASAFVARLTADALRAKPDLVLGLATGRTMEPVYARLIELHRHAGLDFSRCTTFNLDEYVGVAPDDPRSYRHTMQRLLFDHVNVRPGATHLPDGMAADVARTCADYEAAIEAAGGVDLQLLGIGSDGHIGFNEPLSSFSSKTREKCLTPDTVRQNAGLCGGEDRVPRRALTMGVGTILASRRAVMLVTGKAKAELLARVVEGPITAMLSGCALHFHRDCIVVADADAASALAMRDYYRFAFENSPEWDAYR